MKFLSLVFLLAFLTLSCAEKKEASQLVPAHPKKRGFKPYNEALKSKEEKRPYKETKAEDFQFFLTPGQLSLLWAVENEDYDLTDALLKIPDVDPRFFINDDFQNLVHLSALKDNTDILSLFTDKGMSINTPDINGNTPFHLVAMEKGRRHASKLLDLRANPNFFNLDGFLPLHYVIDRKDFDFIKFLVHKEVMILSDFKSNSLLHVALWNESSRVFDGEEFDMEDLSLLREETLSSHHDFFKSDKEESFVTEEDRILYQVIVFFLLEQKKTLEILDARNENGKTALHLAMTKEDPVIVEKLLNLGANPNLRDEFGLSALDLAVKLLPFTKYEALDLISLLLKYDLKEETLLRALDIAIKEADKSLITELKIIPLLQKELEIRF